MVKLPSASSTPKSAGALAVFQAPGDAFVTRRLELPAGLGEDEVAGFVALRLEEISPFPLDQLYHGHLRAPDGSAVFVFAAYRRRFAPEQTEAWPKTLFVLPDFAPALKLSFEADTVVLLRTEAALTALYFEGGKPLPLRTASRPLAADAPAEAVEQARRRVTALVDGGSREVSWRLARPPQPRAQGLHFNLAAERGGAGRDVTLPTGECWAMDIRDPEFVAQQRRRIGVDLLLWRAVQVTAAVFALLVLGEVLLLGGKGYVGWQERRIDSRKAEVAAIEDKNLLGNSLEEFGRSGLQPFEMMSAVGPVRPGSVVFVSATAEGADNLVIDGTAANIADVNAYMAALRLVPQVESVEEKSPPRSRDAGTTFSVNVKFRADAFARVPAVAGGAK